jgi:hypothetical protein
VDEVFAVLTDGVQAKVTSALRLVIVSGQLPPGEALELLGL